jgi:site-specific DNA-methyltransferase (adenine-specific)
MTTKFHITCEDCIKGMTKMASNSVDVVVTSPPYNLGTNYTRYNDSRQRDEYLVWTRQWAADVRRVLQEDGSLFLNVGASPRNPWLPHEILFHLKDIFVLQNTFHWVKSITLNTKKGSVSAGHFKPLNSQRFITDCHEYVFHLTKTGNVALDRLAVGVAYQDKSNIKRWAHTAGADLRCRGNCWFVPYSTIGNRAKDRPHPATFPVALPTMCIRLHGVRPDLVVLDPFLGIGSSALAALEAGVGSFFGFDIDPDYIAHARSVLASKGEPVAGTRFRGAFQIEG